jgi:hypothetical protein
MSAKKKPPQAGPAASERRQANLIVAVRSLAAGEQIHGSTGTRIPTAGRVFELAGDVADELLEVGLVELAAGAAADWPEVSQNEEPAPTPEKE